MFRKLLYILLIGAIVTLSWVASLKYHLWVGFIILLSSLIPLVGLLIAKRSIVSALPDIIFGAIDAGLLVLPAIWGGMTFGFIGAVTGAVIGDALTDSIAGFFEGGVAMWLREKGIVEAREPITTSLGKMGGCLLGSGVVFSFASIFGIKF